MREARFPRTLPPDLAGRVAWYRRHVEAGFGYGVRHPARARVLVYEELVAEPRAVLGELMAWLGEELADEQLEVGGPKHGSGLEDPKAAAARGVHGGSVGRWEEVLSDEEARAVWAELGPLWRELDPGLRRWRPPRRLAG
jgi:hypothetical protein